MMLKNNSNFKKGIGWGLAILVALGLFSYLTFIPNQTFAAYDWETRKLSDISTMQEMNAKICENSSVNDTKQLEDERDGKKYWVTKLADENCWMTQNLDYDGGGTKQQDISKWNGSGVTNTTAAYYNPDEGLTGGNRYYYNGPDGKSHGWNSAACTANTNGLSDCSTQGFVASTIGDDHYLVGNYYSWPAPGLPPNGKEQVNKKPLPHSDGISIC